MASRPTISLAVGTKGSLQATIQTEGSRGSFRLSRAGRISNREAAGCSRRHSESIDWPRDDVFGETTCNIGVISGGTRANVISSEAEAIIQIRLAIDSPSATALLEKAIDGRAALEYKSVHDPIRLTCARRI